MRFGFWGPTIFLVGLALAAPVAALPDVGQECVERMGQGGGGTPSSRLWECLRDGRPLPQPNEGDGGGGGGPNPEPPNDPSACPVPNDECEVPPVEEEARGKANEAAQAADSLAPDDPPSAPNETDPPAAQPEVPPEAPAPDPPVEPEPGDPEPIIALVPKAQILIAPLPDLLLGDPERAAEPGAESAKVAAPPADPIVEPVPAFFLAPKELDPLGTAVALTVGVLLYAALLFYNRLSKDQVLASDARKRILRELSLRPGLTCAEIARELGVHHSTAVHHMRVLEKFEQAVGHRTSAQVTFFQRNGSAPPASRAEIVALRRPANAAFLEVARRFDSFRTRQMGATLGIPRSTASDRIRVLVGAGLVERSPKGFRLTPRARERLGPPSALPRWGPSTAPTGLVATALPSVEVPSARAGPAFFASSSGPT